MKILYNTSYFIKNLSNFSSKQFFQKIFTRDDTGNSTNFFNYLVIENILQYQFDTNAEFIMVLLEKSDDILEAKSTENETSDKIELEEINLTIFQALTLLGPQVQKFKMGTGNTANFKSNELQKYLKSSTLVGLLPERRAVDLYDCKKELRECNYWLWKVVRA